MIYCSKKDWWPFGTVWGAVLAPLAVGLYNVLGGGPQQGGQGRSLYVSPGDKRGFTSDLADAAPGLESRGERVVRTF